MPSNTFSVCNSMVVKWKYKTVPSYTVLYLSFFFWNHHPRLTQLSWRTDYLIHLRSDDSVLTRREIFDRILSDDKTTGKILVYGSIYFTYLPIPWRSQGILLAIINLTAHFYSILIMRVWLAFTRIGKFTFLRTSQCIILREDSYQHSSRKYSDFTTTKLKVTLAKDLKSIQFHRVLLLKNNQHDLFIEF